MPPAPPVAEKRNKTLTHHKRERIDPYYWLRDERWQEVMRDPALLSSDIRTYLEAENDYTKAALEDTKDLQARLFEEMKGRIKEDESSVPMPDGPYEYYVRYETGGQHPVYCRQPRGGVGEKILLHGDKEAEGQSYFQIGGLSHSPDHKVLAYALDLNGSEFYEIRFREIDSGNELPDRLPNASGGFVWSADGRVILYTILDDHHRPVKVMRHRLGTATAEDDLVYEEKDPAFFLGVSHTESHRFLIIDSHDHQTSEVRLLDANDPFGTPQLIHAREEGHEYGVSDHGDHLLIHTNTDGAEDFKIMNAPLSDFARKNWQDVVPHSPGRLILSFQLLKNYCIRTERENALPRIVISRIGDGGSIDDDHVVAFEEEAYALGTSSGYEFETTNLRFSYSSPTTPQQTFDYDVASKSRQLRKTQEVPSGHKPDDYVTARVQAMADDGVTIPITLLARKDTPRDGSAPLLLYGYGSYGISIPAGFSTNRLSLVDRGFVYAIAHIRGGKEKGYGWYTDGKRLKKRNTFSDFVACARHLIDEKYTSKGRIIGHGGSAGGLLMGAVANMAPDVFNAIVADVPFVDTLTTICDDTLPLTPPEWTEWGNPIEDAAVYDYMASYSPYDNVAAQDYPHIFALGGLTDPRVTYWEPAKWVAKMRALKTDNNLLLLKTNMEAGHGGASGRFEQLEETALIYAFMLKAAGMHQDEAN